MQVDNQRGTSTSHHNILRRKLPKHEYILYKEKNYNRFEYRTRFK